MKNYVYGWELKDRGYIEVSEIEYSNSQKDMRSFIAALSEVLVKANCGWDGLQYKVMKTLAGYVDEYMVLCVDGDKARWIPITANSKGANLQVLGENIF